MPTSYSGGLLNIQDIATRSVYLSQESGMPKKRCAVNFLNPAFRFDEGRMIPTENTRRIMEVGREYNPDLELDPLQKS